MVGDGRGDLEMREGACRGLLWRSGSREQEIGRSENNWE